MFRGRLPFSQIVFATLLGVAGGVYVFKPVFEPLAVRKTSEQQNQNVPEKQKETD
ncbi:protein PIGBOS1 [Cottoperca gobio]|uniref:Protein PIGBOS1 n=1 Tax=Cottoperca gobio TaxID=56716 RepID=A0A6J2S6F9_COTGO|nr:protein PIGBOS1 [Cottoperca gobio]